MKKRILTLLLAVLLPLTAVADTRIMVATDLHYLAPSLYADSELFQQVIRYGDGKLTQESPALLEALLAEARHQRPDALILTGDLTFNGEKQSHLELAAAMERLWDEGIPVYVIPGNHDIGNPGALAYTAYSYGPTENVTAAEFREIWARCLGPEERGAGMSFTVSLPGNVRLLMTDVSVYGEDFAPYGLFTDGHARWLAQALAEAEAAGATVITATHQNLLSQTSFSSETYLIRGGERMQAMLAQAGVRLNLSGHIHAQHTMRSGDLTDAATGAYSISPHRWAMVRVAQDGEVRYSAEALCPEHLRAGFPEMSAKFFASVTVIKLRGRLAEADISLEDQEIMLNYAARFNTHFFAGTLDPADPFWTEDAGYALWNANRDRLSFGDYMMRNLAYEEALRSAP